MFSIKDLPIKNNQSFLNYQQYHIYIYFRTTSEKSCAEF